MTENVKEILKKAVEALDSGNANECIDYCEQAFSLEPEDSNVKIMKAVSILITYNYSDALQKVCDARDILKTITDVQNIEEYYKVVLVDTVYAIRNCWEKDNRLGKNLGRDLRMVKSDQDDFITKILTILLFLPFGIFDKVMGKKNIRYFMENIIELSWLQSSPVFFEATIENMNDKRIKDYSFIKKLIKINKEKDGETKDLIEQLDIVFRKYRRRRRIMKLIKWIILIVAFVAIFGTF